MPVTDATAFFGKMSETVVKMLADQAAWALARIQAREKVQSITPSAFGNHSESAGQ
jgi:hypothetical protein